MQIKIHRGTHQIGGCITEIKTAAARIFIDIGSELPSADKKENERFDIDGVTCGTSDCDAVLVTHGSGGSNDVSNTWDGVVPALTIQLS